jgi:hypothetical protein
MTCSCVWHPGCRASGGRARPHSLAGVACTPHPSAPGPPGPGQHPWTIRSTGRGLVYATALPTILQFLPCTQTPCGAAGLGSLVRAQACGGGRHLPGPVACTPHTAMRAHTPGARHPCGVLTAACSCLSLVVPARWQSAACPSLSPTPSAARTHHSSGVSWCSRLPRRDGLGKGREACVLASLWEMPPRTYRRHRSYLLETPPRTYWRPPLVPTGDTPSYLWETPLVLTGDTVRTYWRRIMT